MKEIAVISGKGGTGKTTFVAALASLAKNYVFADCDVDAADLHLILTPEIKSSEKFFGGKKAFIFKDKCVECGICREVCEFNSISEDFVVDSYGCEGCGACYYFCKHGAISFEPSESGEIFISSSRFGTIVHARLHPGEENSGKLVTKVRNEAKREAVTSNAEGILIDGSPGVGCSVIASITGVDYVLVVTEPTLSGLSDLKRTLALLKHFGLKSGVLINKFDINNKVSAEIENFVKGENVDFLGKLPFNPEIATVSMEKGLTVLESFPKTDFAKKIKAIAFQLFN